MKEGDVVNSSDEPQFCKSGAPVKCGDVIRLEHTETAKNVHTHEIRSPLSGNFEVSGFGDDGEGDSGDNWKIECLSSYTGFVTNEPEVVTGSTKF